NVAKQDPGVNGEIIDSLIALLDESVAIDFPGEFLGLAADFLECLVNGDGSDGDRGIANNPLTRLMNIFAGGKIHDGIGAPLGGPTHFLDLFLDAGGNGAVADVGVNFHQEVAPDNHGLAFGMIDVGGDNCAPSSDLGPDKFRGD